MEVASWPQSAAASAASDTVGRTCVGMGLGRGRAGTTSKAYGAGFDEAAQDHATRPRLDVGVAQVAAVLGGLVEVLLDHAHVQPRGLEDHELGHRERAAAVRLKEWQGRLSVHATALLHERAVLLE